MTPVVLVLNCGSSSAKFAVIDAQHKTTLISGLAECLNSADASISLTYQNKKQQQHIPDANHDKALSAIVQALSVYEQLQIVAIGHRVVHGGETFTQSCLVTESVLKSLLAVSNLAPLHTPANMAGIYAAQKAYPDLPQVLVFDTAFHQTLPETAYLYAIPYDYYRRYGVRRYGFHGTSYRYINQAIPDYNRGQTVSKVVVAHLGNGASVCAIHNGQSVATSMGFTPLDGLLQGTRSGSIDPALVAFLSEQTRLSAADITEVLWKQSGLLGLSEKSNDCRVLETAACGGNQACQRALNVFVARLQETIGAYAAVMNGVDALVFTGGIGENSAFIRAQTIAKLGYLGFAINQDNNATMIRGRDGNIADHGSKPIWVIPTNEELMIAEDVLTLTGL